MKHSRGASRAVRTNKSSSTNRVHESDSQVDLLQGKFPIKILIFLCLWAALAKSGGRHSRNKHHQDDSLGWRRQQKCVTERKKNLRCVWSRGAQKSEPGHKTNRSRKSMISSKNLEILEKSPRACLMSGLAFWEPLDFKTTVGSRLIRRRIKVRIYLSPPSAAN